MSSQEKRITLNHITLLFLQSSKLLSYCNSADSQELTETHSHLSVLHLTHKLYHPAPSNHFKTEPTYISH